MDVLSSASASSSNRSARCFGLSPGASTAATADGSSAAAANAKRKLEHATATHTIKMPRDTTQRRRGSSSIASSDPCAMKRSLSDGTMYVLALDRLYRPPPQVCECL